MVCGSLLKSWISGTMTVRQSMNCLLDVFSIDYEMICPIL